MTDDGEMALLKIIKRLGGRKFTGALVATLLVGMVALLTYLVAPESEQAWVILEKLAGVWGWVMVAYMGGNAAEKIAGGLLKGKG